MKNSRFNASFNEKIQLNVFGNFNMNPSKEFEKFDSRRNDNYG